MSKKDETPPTGTQTGKIIIRLWPKTPVLYPMAILALICGIVGQIFGVPDELKDLETTPPAVEQPENKGEIVDPTKPNVEGPVIPNVEKSVDPTVVTPEPSEPTPDPVEPPVDPNPGSNEVPEEPTPAPDPTVEETPEVAPMAFKPKIDKGQSGIVQTILSLIFLAMLAFSLFVVCIDFEVRWSLLVLVVLLMIVMGVLMADKLEYINLPPALSLLDNFILYATPLFYYGVFGIWVLLMIVSALIARFHFVKIESNEVVVVRGVLENQKRMSTFRMHYTKEIQDVFEYYLPFVRSGRLVLNFPNEEQPLIMDNVLGINKVLKELDKSSSAFQVRGVD